MRPIVIALALLLTACESAEETLERLKQDEAYACAVYESAKHFQRPDSVIARAQTKCDLARRELNAFMNKR